MRSAFWLIVTTVSVVSGPALAAETAAAPSDVIFFIALAILILVGRLSGELMQRVGQPAVMGQLLAGLALGPSVFGALAPHLQHQIFDAGPAQRAMLDAISQLGILMLLLLTGMETDLKLVRRVGRAAASVSVAGIVLPFACGVALGQYLPDDMLPQPNQRLVASLFLGTALSISSVKIVAMVVREMNFLRRDIGQVIVASAIIDDTIGWVIIAITFSLASQGTVDLTSLAQRLVGAAVFLLVSFTIGRRLVSGLIRWSNDHLVSDMPVISVILVLMLLMALTTQFIGLHTVLGAFVCGILVGESPILTRHIDEQLRGLILGLFMPVFFALAGLTADLTVLGDPRLLELTFGLVAIASIGKAAGAFVGGRIGGLKLNECIALACGMNARGSTEVIVASIGLSLGMLSHDMFTVIVAMAVITTMAMPPMLRWALARLPMSPAESRRLEREAFEEKGFVANLERLLLAVDNSANGRFAARLAGLVVGPKGLPTTVLQIGREARRGASNIGPTSDDDKEPKAAIHAGASAADTTGIPKEEISADAPTVTTRHAEQETKAAVAEEARRGYDMLLIGLDEPLGAKGFHARVSRAAAGFDGALAVLMARGEHLRSPIDASFSILLPVDRTDASRRATEIALALARGSNRVITALHVAHPRAAVGALSSRWQEEIVLKDAVAMAERYGMEMRTVVQTDAKPDQVIVAEARRGGHDLIVMGVNRRSGEVLDFGPLAADVMATTEASILFVSG